MHLMHMLTQRRYGLICGLALLVTACATGCVGDSALTREKLDPVTSVTIRYSEHPLVFFRKISGRAAFAKDYVDLGPIEINRSGDYRYYLWLGIWTADGDATTDSALKKFDSVIILADGAELRLAIKGRTAKAIGASEPIYSKPASSAIDAYYEVSIDQLRVLADAANLQLRFGGDDSLAFERWDNRELGEAALLEFLSGPTY